MDNLYKLLNESPVSDEEHLKGLKEKFQINDLASCNGAYLWGSGQTGQRFLAKFREIGVNIAGFIDNNQSKRGSFIQGLRVFSPYEILDQKNNMIVITSMYYREIAHQLKMNGFTRVVPYYFFCIMDPLLFPDLIYKRFVDKMAKDKDILQAIYRLLSDPKSKEVFLQILKFRLSLQPEEIPLPTENQYFPGGFWQMNDNEVYVDIGATNGDVLQKFLEQVQGKFNKYFAIEPDKNSYQILLTEIHNSFSDKIIPINVGVGAKSGTLKFAYNMEGQYAVKQDGGETLEVRTLDELFYGENITTIKMDVEGYEPEVLLGAEKIIRNKKPKLAVCVYHEPWHLWTLPWQIIQYRSDYKLYLRHHDVSAVETVLYAL
ncbi:MAG: FkbM family methyltransferase [Eubacteriales bacterium]